MKLRYLDIHNCQALMPKLDNLVQIIRQFDGYLGNVNEDQEERGLIDRLLESNRTSQGKNAWERLYRYDADIGFTLDLAGMKIDYEVKAYYKYPELARPISDQRVVGQFWQRYENGTKWGYKMPLQCLLKNWGDANEGYKCYLHTITSDAAEFSYAGITKRNWLGRLDEHLYEMRTGSRKLFHKAWRDSLSLSNIAYGSELLDINASYDVAMSWEEWFVDTYTLRPNGLNMIPGGLKGLEFLHEHRITDRVQISLEERDHAVAEYVRRNPRKGIPNPFISELWKDDDFYLRVMAAREKTLSPDQVKQIRTLAAFGWDEAKITDEVEALNELQVRNVLKGKTYKRVH